MFPKARTEKITVRQLAEETLVYDQERHKAHCLNPTAAFVWKHCDGKTALPKLADLLEEELGIDNGQAVARLALEQLSARNLLAKAIVPLSGAARWSRRETLKKLAVAAVALPIVMTVTAKGARVGASNPASTSPCGGSCTGIRVGGLAPFCIQGSCAPVTDSAGRSCLCKGMTVANNCMGTCSA